MPFIPNTPESFIKRSDSRDPAATCSGVTQNGRPCRRPIAAGSPRSSSKSSAPSTIPTSEKPAYCYQHQDQAAHHTPPPGLQKSTIRKRTSIDTLVDRLGLLEVESPVKASPTKRRPHSANPAAPTATAAHQIQPQISEKPSHRPRPTPEPLKLWNLLCCSIQVDAADEEAPARPVAPKSQRKHASAVPGRPTAPNRRNDSAKLSPNASSRPGLGRDPPSRTTELLSLIPKEVSPETTALLLTELAKPPSALDEPGFIYIFWLTSGDLPNKPSSEATSFLLAPPSDASHKDRRRTSDVLQSYATNPNPPRSAHSQRSPDGPASAGTKKPILLKIGRANNVQRRMNEWQRQCGYDLSLIRFYPYIDTASASPSPSPRASPSRGGDAAAAAAMPRKVPNAHKVERLIHLELSGRGKRAAVGRKCGSCGTAHREWFEIEGSRAGLREVDELIRRWVAWAEGEAGGAAR